MNASALASPPPPESTLSELLFSAVQDSFDGRDREIMERRFGLVADRAQTLQVIGDSIGVSRERVRQLIQRNLRRMLARGGRRTPRVGDACAELLQYVRTTTAHDSPDRLDKVYELVVRELSHLRSYEQGFELVLYLLGYRDSARAAALAVLAARLREAEHQRARDALTARLNQRLATLLVQLPTRS